MAVKLKVNKDACVGCGLCVGSYSDVFTFDADNKAEVVAECDESVAEEAIASCPAGAIEKE